MSHFLITVYIKDEDRTLEPEDVIDSIVSQYGEFQDSRNEYTSPSRAPRFDYFTLAHKTRGYSAEYLTKVRKGKATPFGIVAPEIGWFDRYDHANFDYQAAHQDEDLKRDFEEKIEDFHKALVKQGYHPIPVDFHN